MWLRFGAVAATLAIGIIPGAASDSCLAIQKDIGAAFSLSDHALYFRPDPIRGDEKPKWQQASGPLIESLAPRGRKTTFAYVVNPLVARTGAVNIRIRTEALGLSKDVQRVRIDRTRVSEKCGFFGATRTRDEYATDVSTLAYEEYHQIGKASSAIERFHFEYRNDHNTCVRTDAGEHRAIYRFAVVEAGYIRAVQVDGLSNADGLAQDIISGLTKLVAAPLKIFASTTAEAAVNPAQAIVGPVNAVPRTIGDIVAPNHYSHLHSLLRKYNAQTNAPDCIRFLVQTGEADRATYISVTDLDGVVSTTWKINWIAN